MRTISIFVCTLALTVTGLIGCDGGTGGATAPTVAAQDESAPAAPPTRRTLPDAEKAGEATLSIDRLTKIDVAGGLASGEVTIATNDTRFQDAVTWLVDGDVANMAISNSTNPMDVTITFTNPTQLRAARAYLAGSSYDWVIEPAPGEGRRLAENVPERTWSQIDLPEPLETSVVRLEFLRLERDDVVHVSEIELYAEPPG